MLIMFSDVHLTDGSTANNPSPRAFKLLQSDLEPLPQAKQADEVRFVLLGDIFDLVRTDYWHRQVAPELRPWGGSEFDPETGMNRDPAVAGQFEDVLEGVLATASAHALIECIQAVCARASGKPVGVTYVVGNHDRAFNNFPHLCKRVEEAFHPVPVEFVTRFSSEAYGVLARHGHEWDGSCHGAEFLGKVLRKGARVDRFDPAAYRVLTIGELVTAELMSGLVFFARKELPQPEAAPFLARLLEVNNLRPMSRAFRWLAWLTQAEEPAYTDACCVALRHALDGLLNSRFARQWDKLRPVLKGGDLTDILELARSVLKEKKGAQRLRSIVQFIDKNILSHLPSSDGYGDHAAEEAKALQPALQYVVYGHTHQARQRCFSAEHDGHLRMYVNTGTFLPLIEEAENGGYYGTGRLAYVCFYGQEEDTEHRAEDAPPTMSMWEGTLRKEHAVEALIPVGVS